MIALTEESEKQLQGQWGSSREEVGVPEYRSELLGPTGPTCPGEVFGGASQGRQDSSRGEEISYPASCHIVSG